MENQLWQRNSGDGLGKKYDNKSVPTIPTRTYYLLINIVINTKVIKFIPIVLRSIVNTPTLMHQIYACKTVR